jgi:hypothetical protein
MSKPAVNVEASAATTWLILPVALVLINLVVRVTTEMTVIMGSRAARMINTTIRQPDR